MVGFCLDKKIFETKSRTSDVITFSKVSSVVAKWATRTSEAFDTDSNKPAGKIG